MRRPSILWTCALLFALGSTPAFAQDPAAAAPAKPAEPKLTFTTDAGILLVQIKGDQTAAFEELISRLKAGASKTTDATAKQLLTSMKAYKTAEGAGGGNALYVVIFDPAVKGSEHELFQLMQKVLTPEELRAPETAEFFKKATGAFVTGYNKLSLTPLGGGQ
jgi:hypothetical protein